MKASRTNDASCNRPRRAKRPSTGGNHPAVEARASPPCSPLAPTIVVSSADVNSQGDGDDLNPAADVPQPKRRGRKPSSLSRTTRESTRRQNHSRIEKARRTKINEALSMLRDLVPVDTGRKPSTAEEVVADDGDDVFVSGSGKKPHASRRRQGQEKEFKLEILEKAVAYVQELQEKVRVLEVRDCDRCSGMDPVPSHYSKRKRDEILSVQNARSSVDIPEERPNKRFTSTQTDPLPISPYHSNSRLPSISSWLPKYVASSALPESHSPSVNTDQLPTPSPSAVIDPSLQVLPAPSLRLERPMATRNLSTPTKYVPTSPSWTQEDESVASLLLRIKSSSSPESVDGSATCALLPPKYLL